jgi:integrase
MTELIEAHVRHIQAAGLAENTVDDRRKILTRVNRDLPYGLDQAATEELEAWFAKGVTRMGRPWSRKTRATYHEHVAAFYRWATRGGDARLDWDPFASVPHPKAPRGVPHPATDRQLADILDRAARPHLTAIKLAAFAGMRASEIAAATREQLLLDDIEILGKGGRTRLVPCHQVIADEAAGLGDGRIFWTPTRLPATGDWLSGEVSQYLTSLGYPQLTLHWFRHWFATTTLKACKNIRVVQELLGHSDPGGPPLNTNGGGGPRRFAVGALPALATATC